jgi:hypothetical protein
MERPNEIPLTPQEVPSGPPSEVTIVPNYPDPGPANTPESEPINQPEPD